MARRGRGLQGGSRNPSVWGRAVGYGSTAGVLLTLGLSPVVGVPAAHADFDDLLDAALGSLDSAAGSPADALPAASLVDVLGTGGAVGTMATLYNDLVYGPMLEVSQVWASSPLGTQVDNLVNEASTALFGQNLIGAGGLLSGSGNGGFLFGQGAGAAAATGAGTTTTAGGGLTGTYTVTSQWNDGFTANYVITNTGTTPLTNWQAQFDLPAAESITNMWNADYTVSDGHYVLTPESYDSTIAPGQSVIVGFQGADNGAYTAPAEMSASAPGTGSAGGSGTGGGSDNGDGSGSSVGTGAGHVTGAYTLTSQWNNGYTASYVITNTGTTPLTNWQAQFDLPAGQSISSMWNADYTVTDGHYVLSPESYDSTIAPGQSVTIGYQAADNGSYAAPTDMSVSGQAATTGGDGGSGSTGGGTSGGSSTGGGDNTGGGQDGGAGGTSTGGGDTGPITTSSGTLTGSYSETSTWAGGYTAGYVITNPGTTPLTWTATIDLPAGQSITNMWGGAYTGSDGQYTITPASYDTTIAPGHSVTVGFQATDSGPYVQPTAITVTSEQAPIDPSNPSDANNVATGTATGTTGDDMLTKQYGLATVGNYFVQNNDYGGSGQQLNVTPTGFSIAAEQGNASTYGAPLAYPSIVFGCHYTNCSPDTPLPEQVSDITSATSGIDYTFPAKGTWDASYDIWLDPKPLTNGVNDQEIMIWFAHHGPVQPVGQPVADETIDGKDFTVWQGYNGQNYTTSFVADSPITSWSSFDLLPFITDTEQYTKSGLTDDWYLTSVQAGFEPWSDSEGAAVSNFHAEVTGAPAGTDGGAGSTPTADTAGGTSTPPAGDTGVSATNGALLSHYSVTDQWNGGYTAAYTITNTGTTPLTNWQATFELPPGQTISNLWGGSYTHSPDGEYVVTGTGSAATLQPGQTVTVGFQASDSGSPGSPTDMSATAQPAPTGDGGSGSTGSTNTPPPPAGDDLLTQKYGLASIGDYFVQNNDWNGSGQQLNVTPTGFTIAAEQGSASTSGAPLAYPSIVFGCHYTNCSPDTVLPEQVAQISSATSSIDYNFPTDPNAIYDASYDIWLNPTAITNGVNQQEVMIWFNHQGPIQPVGQVVEKDVDIDGKDFDIWQGYNGQNYTTSFVADTPITSWNDFNILDFITQTEQVSNSGVNNDWYLTSVQAGYEPWNSGVVGGGINSFSAAVK